MGDTFFHQGDLQSGIARAIAENKLVICFVRDSAKEASRVWENEWLGSGGSSADLDSSLGSVLAQRAVLLRIDLGTQEATFLNAFCAVETAPMLVVIRNGQVLEKMESGISEDEFRLKLLEVCGLDDTESTAITPDSEEDAGAETTQQQPSDVQSLLSERAQRLEVQRQQRDDAEKAERIARANARRKEAEEAESSQRAGGLSQNDQKHQARDAWIYEQKRRKDDAKKERERILKQIESDRQERRAQKEREKEGRQAGGTGESSSIQPRTSRSIPSPTAKCALQVRLFDGSSIRGSFPSGGSLAEDVRSWIKQASPEGGADLPYSFRQILAPQPSRSIEVSEEHRSLQQLDLFPTATLVLVPVEGYTSAYQSANGGYLGSAMNAAYWCADAASSLLSTAISYIPGTNLFISGGNNAALEQSNAEESPVTAKDGTARSDNGKFKTLFDQRGDQDSRNQPATFYNGNSSAFEGNRSNRSDEDEER